jgi:hypothetical protein
MNLRLKLAAMVALITTVPAFAQIKINDNLSVTGWTVGSYQYTSTKGGLTTNLFPATPAPNASSDSFNDDAAFLGATVTPTKNVIGTFSLYYKPLSEGGATGSGTQIILLDANVALDCGGGLIVTAGKYLSPLGYESYYAISDNMITLANQQFLAPIPGYHEGIKIDYSPDRTVAMELGLVDSLYGNNPNQTEGDGHLEHNFGTEGFVQYTGIENLIVRAGAGYSSKGDPQINPVLLSVNGIPIAPLLAHDVYVLDIWASYQITKKLSVAAEEIYKDGGDKPFPANVSAESQQPPVVSGPNNKGSNWLAYLQYKFTDKFSSWFCFSGEDVNGATAINLTTFKVVPIAAPRYWKASISPAYAITANLTVKAQYSYTKYSSFTAKDANFFGAQVAFKF